MLLINPAATSIAIADAVSGTTLGVVDGAAKVTEQAPTQDLILAELRLIALCLRELSGVTAEAAEFLETD